jgi:hypothetical protein
MCRCGAERGEHCRTPIRRLATKARKPASHRHEGFLVHSHRGGDVEHDHERLAGSWSAA